MNITIILLVAIIVSSLGLLALKTNAAVVFLALCAGSVMVTLVGKDISLFAATFGARNQVAPIVAQVALLLLPAVLTAIFLKGSSSKGKIVLQVLPAVAGGVVAIMLVVPLLTPSAQSGVAKVQLWRTLQSYQTPILLVSVFGSLFVAAANKGKHRSSKKHKDL